MTVKPHPLLAGSYHEPLWSTSPIIDVATNGWIVQVPFTPSIVKSICPDCTLEKESLNEPTVVGSAFFPFTQRCLRSGHDAVPIVLVAPWAVYQTALPALSYV